MTTLSEKKIVVSPIGKISTKLLKSISREIERIFGYSTETISFLHDVSFSLDTVRDQYCSTLILEKLDNLAPQSALKIIAIADVDLYIPILTYVYGEAQLDGRTCVVSTNRLNAGAPIIASTEAFHKRVTKEAVHELGHTFGLHHCPEPTCIMHYCRSLEDVDKKSDQLCRYCTVLLDDEKTRLEEKEEMK